MGEQVDIHPVAVRVETAARLLDSSPSTVLFWIKTGQLPATKVGRSWRIHMADIDALVRRPEAVPA